MAEDLRYPLEWPANYPRTRFRVSSLFQVTNHQCTMDLLAELERVGAETIVISTNIALRRDGLPRANQLVTDPGVAVYFTRNGGQAFCMACDKYDSPYHNMRGITKCLEALRALERHGASGMLDRAFTGFKSLPATTLRPWWTVLGFDGQPDAGETNTQDVNLRYRRLARQRHPDHGGTDEAMRELNRARDEAHRWIGGS